MSKLRLIGVVVGAFVAGVAFVLACGNGDSPMIDAGRDANAAECSSCEAAITPARIYQVRDSSSQISAQPGGTSLIISFAECNDGDVLLGGGCFIHQPGATMWEQNRSNAHQLIDFGPEPPIGATPAITNQYDCVYSNNDNFMGMVVIATAICYHPQAAQ